MTPAVPAVVLQSRGIGGLELLHERLPPWGIEAFAAVTHLGDTWLLLTVAALVYLGYDRGAGTLVIGALFVGFAVAIGLKAWFALPRPSADLRYVLEGSYGFPSGHALGATVGWGSVALTLDRVWTARRRVLAAGVIAAAVALSRVALGVHYLVDVVAGMALGVVVLWIAVRAVPDDPLDRFGLAVVAAAAAVGLSGASLQAVALLGACVGAVAGWLVVEPPERPRDREELVAAAGLGVLLAAATAVLAPTLGLAFGAAAVGSAAVLAAPVPLARWLGSTRPGELG